jgi:hypothetical protein
MAAKYFTETPGSVSAKRPTEIGRHDLLNRFRLDVELPETRQGPARYVVRLEMRSRSPCPGDRWHLEDGFLRISGRPEYLWRAVDQDGEVLDILVQPWRDKRAAERFLRKLLKALNPKFKSKGPDEP